VEVTTFLIAAACLVAGVVAGSLLNRTLSPQEQRRRELEEKLQAKEDELKIYQRDVSDHFIKTADLMAELRRNQQEIGEQLAIGAMRLTSPEIGRKIQDTALANLDSGSKNTILSAIPPEAPKDYAPSVPGGILSENYGFTDIQSTTASDDESSIETTSTNKEDEDDPTFRIS